MIAILKKHSFLFIILISLSGFAQDTGAIFKIGNDNYAQGRYQEAIDAYKRILDLKQESAEVYFNLANAHYKLNNIGPSVYYYEKALQLAPGDSEIRNNAAFADNMKIDAIEPLPENTLKKWVNTTLELLPVDGWAKATVVFVILFVLCFLGYYFAFGTARKRLFFVSFSILLLLTITSLSFSYSAFAKAEKDNPAIVFTPGVEVKSEPKLASTLAFTLHEGTKVMVLEEVNDWSKIRLVDGKTGWIPSLDIKLLNNF